MRLLIVAFIIIVSSVSLQAQKYITAAGIRVGSGVGLTLQQKLWNNYTAEAILQKSLMKNETYASALFEQHVKLLVKGFNFYLGAGPHLVLNKVSGIDDKTGLQTSITNTAYGLSAIGGVELRLNRLLFSLDYVPSINFSGNNIFGTRTGISARYVFIKEKKKKNKEQSWQFWKKWKNDRKNEGLD
jgi:hypothetical protein